MSGAPARLRLTLPALAFAAALAAAPVAAVAGEPASPVPSAAPRAAAREKAPSIERHVYVADVGKAGRAGGVYRYALKKGLPKTVPDGELTGSLLNPVGLAFDRAGNLYVAETSVTKYAIQVYPPGALGSAQPSRTLQLGADERPQFVAVDAAGFLFASVNALGENIYRPGARGSERAMHTIRPPGGSIVDGLAIDQGSGTLYVSAGGVVDVYGDPVGHWQQPSSVLRPAARAGRRFYEGALALGTGIAQLYAHSYPDACCKAWQSGDIAVLAAGARGTRSEPAILTDDCVSPADGAAAFNGMAVSQKYVMLGCYDRNTVFVYRNRMGRQRSVTKIKAPFVAIGDVKLGP